MADGDSTTVNVDLLEGNTNFLHAEDGLTGKGFVDLVEVNIVLSQAGLFEYSWDGVSGTDTHDSWWDTNNSCGDEFTDDGQTETFGDRSAGKDDCCGTV